MPDTQIPVACVQPFAHDRERFASRWPHVLALAERACRAGAKLVVLPEGTVPGYVLGNEPIDATLLQNAARDVARLARECGVTIVYGGAKIVDGKTFNAAICVGPDGSELGFAAKQFLWHFDRRWFTAGATLRPIDTPVGRLGLLVCADGRIPSIASTLVERGAQMLVMPTAWVTSGRDPFALENIQADLMANVRARENAVPFIVANKCGVELESVAYCGKSAIVDATGAFVARAGEREETIVAGTVSIRDVTAPAHLALASDRVSPTGNGRARARIAFAFANALEAARYADLATQADADTFVTFGAAVAGDGSGVLARAALSETSDTNAVSEAGGLRYAFVDAQTLRSPRGFVDARLAGIDLFIVRVDDDAARVGDDAAWDVRFARTRAAELRAFVIVFDVAARRAFAVDPDGVVVAGTFDGFRLATFVYDASRTSATMVAPRTDVLEGLRIAETLRATRAKVPA